MTASGVLLLGKTKAKSAGCPNVAHKEQNHEEEENNQLRREHVLRHLLSGKRGWTALLWTPSEASTASERRTLHTLHREEADKRLRILNIL